MDNELWVILLPITLLPVFFAMGWFAARIDMKTVLKQAKSVPAGFYKSLDALVDRNSGRAARELAEVIDQQPQSYDLNLTLGKLYRQRGENDKAINMHQALLDSPDTVNEKRARVLFELAQNYQSAGLVDRAEQIFIGLQEGNMAREARQHLLSICSASTSKTATGKRPSKPRNSSATTSKPTNLKLHSFIANSPKPRCSNPISTPPVTTSKKLWTPTKNAPAPT